MNKRGLKNRTPISNAIDTKLLNEIKLISKNTKIPLSKLLDEAIYDLIIKYKID